MTRHMRMLPGLLVAMVALIVGTTGPEAWAQKSKAVAPSKRVAASKEVATFAIARIFFEFNSSASELGDLGVHVFLDGEDWRTLRIVNPNGRTIFEVEGKGPYRDLGLTELFFEGAEPDLGDVPLAELLDRFPAGNYQLMGKTVDGNKIVGTATLTHAIPDGPFAVLAVLDGDALVISWNPVTGSLTGETVNIVAYQVIVGAFQVTVPAIPAIPCAVPTVPDSLSRCVTVSPQFVQSLGAGEHQFEVLAIEAGGNQTITEGFFTKPLP